MQYFSEYIDKESINKKNIEIPNSIIIGTLDYIDNNFVVNSNDIIYENIMNNRAIKNDIVFINNNVVINIEKRSIQLIVGILCIDSKIKYGSIKDKLLYLFKPTNKVFPNFYVPYKNEKKINKNIYCIIKFKDWTYLDKLPIGTLVETIGIIGIKEYEYEHLRNYYNLRNNTWKINNDQLKKDKLLIEQLQFQDYEYEVFSIDPIGSKDIDDAFHFKILENNNYEIGIHIASPYTFFKDNLDIVLERASTLYLPNKKYNMLPNEYADKYISLLENQKRYSVSIIFEIDQKFNIINENIKSTIVKNIKNYNYEEFNKIIELYQKNKCIIKNHIEFVDFSEKFFNTNEVKDSHKLVEKWMIYANKKIASILMINNNINSNLILRKHDKFHEYYSGNKELGDIDINNLDNLKLINYLKIKEESSALYEIFDISKEQTHSKLNNEYYTHFTSPIRRCVDFFIHGLIIENKNIYDKNILQKYIDHINTFTKNSKRFNRMVNRLDFLFNIKNLEENIVTKGYIINITKNKLTVYIPEYNLEEKIIIIPKIIEKITDYKLKIDKIKNEKEEYDLITEIRYNLTNTEKIFELYQKINIKLWVFLNYENIFDKLKIEILY
jgi:exoribonuclease R